MDVPALTFLFAFVVVSVSVALWALPRRHDLLIPSALFGTMAVCWITGFLVLYCAYPQGTMTMGQWQKSLPDWTMTLHLIWMAPVTAVIVILAVRAAWRHIGPASESDAAPLTSPV